jgi:hypothetical protein
MNTMRVEIISPPDRDKITASIMIGNEQWSEVNQESDRLQIEIYPCRNTGAWLFGFEETLEALIEAKKRLVGN